MKTTSILLCVALLGAAGAGTAAEQVDCGKKPGRCIAPPAPPMPPVPPAPPALPAPPAPPAHPGSDNWPGVAPLPPVPAVPALPAMPAPPAPPAPPPLPKIPAGAHAACEGKAAGTLITWTVRTGETMEGVCATKAGKPMFKLHSYTRND